MKTLMIPRQTDDQEGSDALPFGMTHPNDTPCPFADAKLPVGYINTCCSFNTETAVETLTLFGHLALANLLQTEMDAEKVPFIAKELQRAVAAIEAQYVGPTDGPDGPRPGGFLDPVTEKFIPKFRLVFETEVTRILRAADWYKEIGRLGFGVAVWY